MTGAVLRHIVRLEVRDRRLSMAVHPFVLPVPDGGVLVRNHHTLISAGTRATRVDYRDRDSSIPSPSGYTTLSTIEEVGPGCMQFSLGDRLILPGKFESYSVVPTPASVAFKLSPAEMENPIHALFLPFLGSALTLLDRVAAIESGGHVLLYGFDVVGAILSQLLRNLYSIPVTVVRTADDSLPSESIRECGAVAVFDDLNDMPTAWRKSLTEVFVLDGSDGVLPCDATLGIGTHRRISPNWGDLAPSIRQVAETYDRSAEMLGNGAVDVEMLVADYIHPESAEQALRLARAAHPGKMLVCDWQ